MKIPWFKLCVAALAASVLILGSALALAQDKPADTTKIAEAKKPVHVGSKACKVCHMGEKKGKMWEIWLDSKHAKSMASLDSTKGETTNPKCLKCHTTGYGEGGFGAQGMEALAVAEGLGSVGCESCHGPGSEYKPQKIMKDRQASIAAGLWIPDEKTCTKCHNAESPTFKGFQYDEYMAKIAHKLPPQQPDTTGSK